MSLSQYEIDKKLGIRNSDDVEAMGIAAYNEECRAIVTRYTKEWETIVTRLGRWIDFRNDYKTMEPWVCSSAALYWHCLLIHSTGIAFSSTLLLRVCVCVCVALAVHGECLECVPAHL